jgi:hypothetical protein
LPKREMGTSRGDRAEPGLPSRIHRNDANKNNGTRLPISLGAIKARYRRKRL